MEDIMEMLVPCVGFVSFFVLIFGTVVLIRWFKHKELLTMIEQGVVPEQYANASQMGGLREHSERATRNWGVVLAMLGLALVVGLWPIGLMGAGPRFPLGLGPWMLTGFVPLFLGLGLLIVHYLTRKERVQEEMEEEDEETEGQV